MSTPETKFKIRAAYNDDVLRERDLLLARGRGLSHLMDDEGNYFLNLERFGKEETEVFQQWLEEVRACVAGICVNAFFHNNERHDRVLEAGKRDLEKEIIDFQGHIIKVRDLEEMKQLVRQMQKLARDFLSWLRTNYQ